MTVAHVVAAVDGALVRIAIAGEVDLANAAAVEDDILDAISNDVTHVSVDLGDLSYVDSAGLRVLFSLVSRLERSQIHLDVVAPIGSLPRRVLELSGLGSLVTLEPPDDGIFR